MTFIFDLDSLSARMEIHSGEAALNKGTPLFRRKEEFQELEVSYRALSNLRPLRPNLSILIIKKEPAIMKKHNCGLLLITIIRIEFQPSLSRAKSIALGFTAYYLLSNDSHCATFVRQSRFHIPDFAIFTDPIVSWLPKPICLPALLARDHSSSTLFLISCFYYSTSSSYLL